MKSKLDVTSPVAQQAIAVISRLLVKDELLQATERFRGLGVPEELITPAMVPNAPKEAEQAIISWATEEWRFPFNLPEEYVVAILAGKVTQEEMEFFPLNLPGGAFKHFVDEFVKECDTCVALVTEHLKEKGADLTDGLVTHLIFRSSRALAAVFAEAEAKASGTPSAQ